VDLDARLALFVRQDAQERDAARLPGREARKKPPIVPGTAVFLTGDPQSAPTALMHSLKHYKVLHEQNVILSMSSPPLPKVPDWERVKMEPINDLFMRVTLTFGYMEQPQHPKRAGDLPQAGLEVRHHDDVVLPVAAFAEASANSGMPMWQDKMFIGLAKRRPMRPNISRSRPGAWSRSARR
jgi:KUP system potassium uptake protein